MKLIYSALIMWATFGGAAEASDIGAQPDRIPVLEASGPVTGCFVPGRRGGYLSFDELAYQWPDAEGEDAYSVAVGLALLKSWCHPARALPAGVTDKLLEAIQYSHDQEIAFLAARWLTEHGRDTGRAFAAYTLRMLDHLDGVVPISSIREMGCFNDDKELLLDIAGFFVTEEGDEELSLLLLDSIVGRESQGYEVRVIGVLSAALLHRSARIQSQAYELLCGFPMNMEPVELLTILGDLIDELELLLEIDSAAGDAPVSRLLAGAVVFGACSAFVAEEGELAVVTERLDLAASFLGLGLSSPQSPLAYALAYELAPEILSADILVNGRPTTVFHLPKGLQGELVDLAALTGWSIEDRLSMFLRLKDSMEQDGDWRWARTFKYNPDVVAVVGRGAVEALYADLRMASTAAGKAWGGLRDDEYSEWWNGLGTFIAGAYGRWAEAAAAAGEAVMLLGESEVGGHLLESLAVEAYETATDPMAPVQTIRSAAGLLENLVTLGYGVEQLQDLAGANGPEVGGAAQSALLRGLALAVVNGSINCEKASRLFWRPHAAGGSAVRHSLLRAIRVAAANSAEGQTALAILLAAPNGEFGALLTEKLAHVAIQEPALLIALRVRGNSPEVSFRGRMAAAIMLGKVARYVELANLGDPLDAGIEALLLEPLDIKCAALQEVEGTALAADHPELNFRLMCEGDGA